jgi:hypothetical protein
MVNETAIVPKRELTPKAWEEIRLAAPVAQAARYYQLTPEQVMFVMAKGYELGLPITTALDFIYPIKNKLSLSPKGALALLHASGKLDGMKIEDGRDNQGDPSSCTVTMKRGNIEYTTIFTMKDAERAGLVRDDSGWKKYPGSMLLWRAMGNCMKVMFPDVTGGMYAPEEFGASVDENGEPLPSNWQVEKPEAVREMESTQIGVMPFINAVKTSPEKPVEETFEQVLEQVGESPKEEKPETKVPVLSDLIEKYGAQNILEANDGLIPQTDEQLIAVAKKLENGDDAS